MPLPRVTGLLLFRADGICYLLALLEYPVAGISGQGSLIV